MLCACWAGFELRKANPIKQKIFDVITMQSLVFFDNKDHLCVICFIGNEGQIFNLQNTALNKYLPNEPTLTNLMHRNILPEPKPF